ncbi:hypothetical protein [Pseudomonas entomophila]|uniref:hypothetical protein n=1 Tax=Pseudomonas entomophila TaxID=312306 RepID=UPI003EBE82FA
MSNEKSTIERYDMLGWRVHLVFDPVLLNAELVRKYIGHPVPSDGMMTFTQVVTPGRYWRHIKCELGTPLMSFDAASPSPEITVAKPFLSYLSCAFEKGTGVRKADVQEMTVTARNEAYALFMSVPLDECVGHYTPEERVRLEVRRGAMRCALGHMDRGTLDSRLGLAFSQHFDALPDAERALALNTVRRFPGSEWLVRPLRFYPRRLQGTSTCILYIAFDADESGRLPASRDGATADESTLGVLKGLHTYIDGESIPKVGYRLNDFTSLAYLLFPESFIHCTDLRQVGNSYIFEGVFSDDRPAGHVAAENTASIISHAEPLVTMTFAGKADVLIKAHTPEATVADWGFEGAHRGRLHAQGKECNYVPPVEQALVHDRNSQKLEPPVLRSSLEFPVWTERVLYQLSPLPLATTVVVKNANPTHFFKLEKAGAKLRLTLWWAGKDGHEQVVDPAGTQWHVLAGNGHVNAAGDFTPGLLSRFSVLLAIEPDDKKWYWAVIIVPLPAMSVDEFIALRESL